MNLTSIKFDICYQQCTMAAMPTEALGTFVKSTLPFGVTVIKRSRTHETHYKPHHSLCVAALGGFRSAHVVARYDAIDDTREDSQYEHYVVQHSSCLLVRLVDDVIARTQHQVQRTSHHLQHTSRLSALPPVAPVWNLVVGSAGNPPRLKE